MEEEEVNSVEYVQIDQTPYVISGGSKGFLFILNVKTQEFCYIENDQTINSEIVFTYYLPKSNQVVCINAD